VDAGKFGGALVAADRVNLASKSSLAGDKSGNCCKKNHDPDYDRNAHNASVAKKGKAGVAELGFADQIRECRTVVADLCGASCDVKCSKCSDEWRHVKSRAQHSVKGSHQQSETKNKNNDRGNIKEDRDSQRSD